MFVRRSPHRSPRIALLLALSGLAGCSGSGGATASANFNCGSPNPKVICLSSCNLGCSATGCARTDIAQNEIIILQFSEDIDPSTVTPSSIRFRTASGDQPVGEFFVNGRQVEFVPTLSISGGQTFFGFSAGDTYTMTIPGGDTSLAVVRGTSGKPFEKTLSCTLQSTLGIVDLNGIAPRATMISPTLPQVDASPRDVEIVLEFNEMIDATPFLSGTQSPVTFSVRRNRAATSGGFECDPNSAPQPLGGTQRLDFDAGRGISILSFRPVQLLPGNICVEINVTDGVADLSGRPAQPQTFTFRTIVVPLTDANITEPFDNDSFLDADASAAQWGNGFATFAPIGGDGRHGVFNVALCVDTLTTVLGKRVYTLNTDNTIIPASNTSTGSPIAITDGRFFFSTMVLPSDAWLKFLGTKAPIVTVAGRLDILGWIDVAGVGNAAMPISTAIAGQVGALAGPFGGNGGKGGDKISSIQATTTGAAFNNQGVNGQDAKLLVGHAYVTSAIGTGGRGSTVFPASGLNSSLFYGITTGVFYTPSAAAGGGGGGFLVPGANGLVVSNNHGTPPPLTSQMGPLASGGAALQLFPFPAGGGLTRASEHFLAGGSGGGGSASHACMAIGLPSVTDKWISGAGGGGGGGAVALRAGNSLRLGPASKVLANGGAAPGSSGSAAGAQAAPAGGGSGGSIVLQSGRIIDLSGLIDVRGGNGGVFNRQAGTGGLPPAGASVQISGGNGAPGYVRLEGPTLPPLSSLSSMQPVATTDNLGVLNERDSLVTSLSKFYSTQLIFGPEFARYEIYGSVDGVPFVLSDDPAVSTQAAQVGSPVRALWQAARLDLATNEPLEIAPWRTSVRSSSTQTGIASDGLNGFRFQLLADYSLGLVITIDRVVVVFRV